MLRGGSGECTPDGNDGAALPDAAHESDDVELGTVRDADPNVRSETRWNFDRIPSAAIAVYVVAVTPSPRPERRSPLTSL